jgi:integrase
VSVKPLGGGRYMVRVYNPHGREYRKVVEGRRAADAHEADMKHRLSRNLIRDPSGARVLLRDYAPQVVASRDLRPTTRDNYARLLRLRILPALGDRPLRTIRHSDVVALARRGGRTRYGREAVVLLASILRTAVLDGLLERSPAEGLRLPPVEADPVLIPEWEQVRAVAKTTTPGNRLAIMLAALTGLRSAEVCGLAVDDLDMLRGQLTVARQLSHVEGRHYLAAPKSRAGRRIVPMPRAVVDELAVFLHKHPPSMVTVPELLSTGSTVPREQRLLFGKAVSPNSLSTRVARAAAGTFTLHPLRHLYTTTLLEAGVPLKVVDEVTGHESHGVTLRVYAHATEAGRAMVAPALDAAWSLTVPETANAPAARSTTGAFAT